MVLGADHEADPLVTKGARWRKDCPAAVMSSVDTDGKSRFSIAALSSTTGMPRLCSSR